MCCFRLSNTHTQKRKRSGNELSTHKFLLTDLVMEVVIQRLIAYRMNMLNKGVIRVLTRQSRIGQDLITLLRTAHNSKFYVLNSGTFHLLGNI